MPMEVQMAPQRTARKLRLWEKVILKLRRVRPLETGWGRTVTRRMMMMRPQPR